MAGPACNESESKACQADNPESDSGTGKGWAVGAQGLLVTGRTLLLSPVQYHSEI